MNSNASADPLRGIAGRAAAHLHREMGVRFADVPASISNAVFDDGTFALSRDSFLFTTESGVRFGYTVGQGLTAWLPSPSAEDEYRLFLWGTVFGAVAWLNGYFPLHASAVDAGGRAVAFTADSGGGKSTMAAALAAHGMPHVCDDTLALHLTGRGPLAVPDRKPLKLWEDAFGLVAAQRLEAIGAMPGKSYAAAASQSPTALPLTDLLVLEEGAELGLVEVRGAAKLDAVVGAMYREFIPAALGRRRAYQRDLFALANGIGIWRLTRPRSHNAADFAHMTELIAALIGTMPTRS